MPNAYSTAYNQSIWVDLTERGRLMLSGRDYAALVHRMSTNDVESVAVGQSVPTVFTTPIGRMIDLATFARIDEESALLITSEGRGDTIQSYLRRNIFFNDKVKVDTLPETLKPIGIFGKNAVQVLAEHFPQVGDLSENGVFVENDLYILRIQPLPREGAGFLVIAPSETLAPIQDSTLQATEADYDLLRIEAGHPIPNQALTDDYIPLEAGLWDAVSFNKGCYTGQEIIARMESRGKLAKLLVTLKSDTEIPLETALHHDGSRVGSLASLEQHPDGHYLGLGYVKSKAAQPNITLYTEDETPLTILDIAGTQGKQERS